MSTKVKTLRISRSSDHQITNRQITRKLKPIETALKKKLLLFYNQKIKGSYTPIELLRTRYDVQINNLIRKTVYDSYFAGTDKVMSRVNKKKEKDSINDISILVKDFDNINKICNEQQEQFWKTIGRIKWRENEIQKPELGIEAGLIGFSAWATYHTFNKAVVAKSRDLAEATQNKIAAVEDEFGEEIPESRVVFKTADDAKVDPVFCLPLADQVFNVDELDDTNTPPMHLHCRCRLIPE